MKLVYSNMALLDIHLGCFGNFKGSDPICMKSCILSLRCAIEKDQSSRLEMLDDLLSSEDILGKVQ